MTADGRDRPRRARRARAARGRRARARGRDPARRPRPPARRARRARDDPAARQLRAPDRRRRRARRPAARRLPRTCGSSPPAASRWRSRARASSPIPPLGPRRAPPCACSPTAPPPPARLRPTSTTTSSREICRRLDGLPLAIELAAARLRSMPIEQLAARLDDRFRLLTGGSRAALPRHRTLRAVVDWSWGLLEEPERALARRLAVFNAGATEESAAAVCGDPHVLDGLAALVDRSLLQVVPDDRALPDARDDPRVRAREARRRGRARGHPHRARALVRRARRATPSRELRARRAARVVPRACRPSTTT